MARISWIALGVLGFVAAHVAFSADVPGRVTAFPGAEGFGKFARGGRGGRVLKVTNLRDNGPGSLRAAIASRGPRTVVFEVSGIIDLDSDLTVRNDRLTIAGQTAPGDGITLRRHALVIEADDVVVRYLRVRPGDAAGVELDGISVRRGRNIVIDHCSTSWATDETLSIAGSRSAVERSIDNVTVQWSIISESLNASVHSKGNHGYGTLLRGSHGARISMHHNLWAHHMARMPRPGSYVARADDPVGPLFDFRNNVFYNWGGESSGYNADSDTVVRYNFVGNYYLVGPNSKGAVAFDESNRHASLFFSANWMNGHPVSDATSVVRLPAPGVLADREHTSGFDSTETADVAYRRVLESSGASRSRDAVDLRVVEEVRKRTGRIIDDPDDVGGWPKHVSRPAPPDADDDGIPDQWEKLRGLDPEDPTDGSLDPDGDGYSNLEDYLESLVGGNAAVDGTTW